MFEDRGDAGHRLGAALQHHRDRGALVLAIPRGGVAVGIEVARALGAEFSLVVARKLPYPDNPEAGFGAVAEDGSLYLNEDAAYWLPQTTIERIVAEQQVEAQRRVGTLRGGRPLPEMAGRTVILVDDGIAMGSTMRAAIALCRARGAAKVVVAAPVAGRQVAEDLATLADEVVVLEMPLGFRAVAQVYRNWYDVGDEEVLELMRSQESESRSQK